MCKVCNNAMGLLLQLNGDLPEHFPNDERRLYVFGCPRRTCSRKIGSIRAFRGVRRFGTPPTRTQGEATGNKESPASEAKRDLGAALFGTPPSIGPFASNTNPFSNSAAATQNTINPFAPLPSPSTLAAKPPQTPSAVSKLTESFAEKARLSSPEPSAAPVAATPTRPWPLQSDFPPPYKQYYLDADYETLSRPPTPMIPTNAPIQSLADDDNEASSGPSVDSKDTFESSLDKDFLRFSTRLGHNPEQVLRYEFRGSPLLYSHTDPVGKLFSPAAPKDSMMMTGSGYSARIPRCQACSRERVFEFQLVPHAITVLEEGREGIGIGKDDGGMEWGTIIVGVCAVNCAPDAVGQAAWREEWVGVQWEEAK
jgi:pre-rRNA-processing protein TSR4